ncbi:MAG: OsmC family protein [Gemmatimonadota bacterium]
MSDVHTREVRLRWTGDGLAFEGGTDDGVQIGVDSSGGIGPSPMELLLLSAAGCMAIDVVMILQKSRVPLDALEVHTVGRRAPDAPKRYLEMRMEFALSGPGDEDQAKLQRAVDLSKDKYCSVLHTLDPELDFTVTVRRT